MRKQSLNHNESIIGRKTRKRMILVDSDTENSIIIEHDKHTKLKCVKDTPLKIDCGNSQNVLEASLVYDNLTESDDDDDGNTNKKDTPLKIDSGNSKNVLKHSKLVDNTPSETDDGDNMKNESTNADRTVPLKYDDSNDSDEASEEVDDEETDEGPDEDQMVMSKATRMSIMGMVPKDNESDESDFIESDDVSMPQKV